MVEPITSPHTSPTSPLYLTNQARGIITRMVYCLSLCSTIYGRVLPSTATVSYSMKDGHPQQSPLFPARLSGADVWYTLSFSRGGRGQEKAQ
ncbi:hypothetical protein FKM82_020672 [Ascaphus truei]